METMGLIDSSFWSGRRVLVTGHTGFKGSWLCLWLQQLGASVAGYSLAPNTQPSVFEQANVSRGMSHSIISDVRDLTSVLDAFKEIQPEIVFHMAAQPLVRESYVNPVDTYSTNVMGTVNVLEATRKCIATRAVLVITTDKCYENREWLWGYRETDAMGGYDPYSNSKACAELVTSAYRNSFFNPADFSSHKVAIASARAGNVIGGGDWSTDRLLPDVFRAISSGQPVQIRNPTATRPWQHVLEPLSGYLMLAEKLFNFGPDFSEAFNFGPRDEDAQPVGKVVAEIVRIWGEKSTWQLDNQIHPHEANYLKLDISKAKTKLGWNPKLNLSQAIGLSVDWTKAHNSGQSAFDITNQQINHYKSLLTC